MPAAVSDRPPRKGPIKRYFIPLKAFSSGFEDSPLSESLAPGAAVCPVGLAGAGFAAFDCRSGFVWPAAETTKEIARVTARTKLAKRGSNLRKRSRPMLSPGKEVNDLRVNDLQLNDLHMVIEPKPAAKGCSGSGCND